MRMDEADHLGATSEGIWTDENEALEFGRLNDVNTQDSHGHALFITTAHCLFWRHLYIKYVGTVGSNVCLKLL